MAIYQGKANRVKQDERALMQGGAFDSAAGRVGERVRDDKRRVVNRVDHVFNAPDFESGDDAIQNFLLVSARAAAPLVNRDAAF